MKLMIATLSFLFILCTCNHSHGQKIGYVNSAEVMQELPETKRALVKLDSLQKALQIKLQQMMTDLENKYVRLREQEQLGELSPKQVQEEGQKLTQEQEQLAASEQEMQTTLLTNQQELMGPIATHMNSMIQQVAMENDFTYIINDSPGLLLYKDPSMDVTDLVKAKLGL